MNEQPHPTGHRPLPDMDKCRQFVFFAQDPILSVVQRGTWLNRLYESGNNVGVKNLNIPIVQRFMRAENISRFAIQDLIGDPNVLPRIDGKTGAP
jgi:hypothetical protein